VTDLEPLSEAVIECAAMVECTRPFVAMLAQIHHSCLDAGLTEREAEEFTLQCLRRME